MGKCKFCRKKAGFLKWKHSECESIYSNSENVLKSKLRDVLLGFNPENISVNNEAAESFSLTISDDAELDDFEEKMSLLKKEATNSFLSLSRQNSVAVEVFYEILEQCLSDKKLSNSELAKLSYYSINWGFDDHSKNLMNIKMVQSRVLTRIEKGERGDGIVTPNGWKYYTSDIPLVLMKSEQIIHATNASFFEERTKTHYVGGSDGFSFKLTKGVYYRTSAFKGEKVKEHHMEHIDNGLFALTTKHIYFHGHRKSFRVRLDRIVAIDPYEDGIGIRKAGVTSKPQIFRDYDSSAQIDAWFVSNAIRVLSKE